MNIIQYLRKNGLKRAITVFYQYKIDKIIQRIFLPFWSKKELQDIIVIESHNDFDCNGGAFYDYLIRKGFNKKFKIVWLLKNPNIKPNTLPKNVMCFPLYKPGIKKNYYLAQAKFLLADNVITPKMRKEQKSFYLTHGAGGLKNVKGVVTIPNDVDYILLQSESYAPIQAEQYSLTYPSNRLLFIGYPIHDILNTPHLDELKKITSKEFNKVIIWMPTFRKGGGYKRNDSTKIDPLGVPLLRNKRDFTRLNSIMKQHNSLLIIKIHPMQDLSTLHISNCSNIIVLTGKDVRQKGIDNYRLMSCTDALISDYSGVAYDYLQLNKPIAYVLNDMKDYKLGFVVDDVHTLIAGHEIYNFSDFEKFIKDVVDERDIYKDKRIKIRDYIYKYHDTSNCERLAQVMQL